MLSVLRRLWDDGGVLASSDIVTFGRGILAGGCRLGLGMRALDGYSASPQPLYTLVDSISLSMPFWRIDSIATYCCAFVSIITLLVPSPSFIFMMGLGIGCPVVSLQRVVRLSKYCCTVCVVPGTMYLEISALL